MPCSSERVVHGQSKRGGRRVGAGAPAGNANGQKRAALPEWLDLQSSDGILRFMREILVPCAITGQLGVRNVTALTSVCKVLLDYESLTKLERRIEVLEKEAKQN